MIFSSGSVNDENRQLMRMGQDEFYFPVTMTKIANLFPKIRLIFVDSRVTVYSYSNSQGWIDYVHFRLCKSFFVVLFRIKQHCAFHQKRNRWAYQ